MFVAFAVFEYAVLLSIQFGKGRMVNVEESATEDKKDKCNKVDTISLRLFIGIYILTVAAYFLFVTHIE